MATIKTYVKLGFGLGLGSILATLLFLAAGMGLFLGGYVLYKKSKAIGKESQDKTTMIIGIVMMALGCLIALGFGAPFLLEAIGGMIDA